jgi:cbb3-type cytochrome oxidase subunit 3
MGTVAFFFVYFILTFIALIFFSYLQIEDGWFLGF